MKERISFLLGSGVSIPVGFPSIIKLTNIVLSGEGVMRHTNGNYYFGEPLYGFPDEYVPRVTLFLNKLKDEIDLYYRRHQSSRLTNYEDLYYVASQIRDSETKDYDNPAVQPLIDKISPEIKPILIGSSSKIEKNWKLKKLATEATDFIRDIVWHSLNIEPKRLDHLCFIKEAYMDQSLSKVDIFTINHDTIIEQYLAQNRIQVNDGFGSAENNMRYWNPDILENNSSKVRLLKLHGSVNWFRFRNDGNSDWSDEKIAIPLEWDLWYTKDTKGRSQWPVDGRPMFLAGTFNKMLDYSSGIYADLHYQFYKLLRETEILVVSGYGFRDKGINTRIIDWIYSHNQNKIIVIHHDPGELTISARDSISNKWDKWIQSKRLIIIKKKIEDTKWEDISYYLKS